MARKARCLPTEVFLCHSSRDHAFVTKLAKTLHRHEVPFWLSTTHLLGAQEWLDEIGRALKRCDWFIVVLSPAAVKSRWVERELTYAVRDPRYDGHLVPLLYRPCDPLKLSWTLGAVQRVDFTGKYAAGCRDLLRIWGITYNERR